MILYPAFTVFLYPLHVVICISLGILCPCYCSRLATAAMAQYSRVICVATASIGSSRGWSRGHSSVRPLGGPPCSPRLGGHCIITALPSNAGRFQPPCRAFKSCRRANAPLRKIFKNLHKIGKTGILTNKLAQFDKILKIFTCFFLWHYKPIPLHKILSQKVCLRNFFNFYKVCRPVLYMCSSEHYFTPPPSFVMQSHFLVDPFSKK